MSVRLKLALILGAFVSLNLAIFGLHELFAAVLYPIITALGA